MQTPLDDDVLAARVRFGEREALDALFLRYYPALLTYLTYQLRDESAAEDIVQTVFFELWERRANFRPERGVRTYLFGAARHRMLNLVRGERRAAHYAEQFARNEAASGSDMPDAAMERHDLQARVRDALSTLPPRGREVVALVREQGLSYQEAADVMGVSVNTIKTQLNRAIAMLRHLIGPVLGAFLFGRLF